MSLYLASFQILKTQNSVENSIVEVFYARNQSNPNYCS
jgi:hypothetical protein